MQDSHEIEDDQAPMRLDFSKRSSGQKRVDRAMRMRLLSLFGLLILIVIAMKEAGKPERWMWLGFDDPAASSALVSSEDVAAGDFLLQPEAIADNSGSAAPGPPNGGLGYFPNRIAKRLPAAEALDGSSDSEGDDFGSDIADPQQTPLALDFWQSTFVKLTDDQQQAFYQLLRRVDASKIAAPETDLPFAATVKSLTSLSGFHQSKILGELAVMHKSEAKTDLTNQLFAFDHSWQQQVQPTLEASIEGKDYTLDDQAVVRSIRSVIDPIVLSNVEDRTGMGNPRDTMAWYAVWDKVQMDARPFISASAAPTPPAQTSLVQLKGQPAAFRGDTVVIKGTVKTIRKKILTSSLLNMERYYEFWVDPEKNVDDGLICVFAENLPAGFESEVTSVEDRFKLVELPVTISGRFFKIRSYQDASHAVSHCPVVIANTFVAVYPDEVAAEAAAQAWQPSQGMLVVFLGLALVGAVGIAWGVYRSTQAGSFDKGRPVSGRVSKSLDALSDDPSVMTDAERVGQLNDMLDGDNS